jgi:hypothetical protein
MIHIFLIEIYSIEFAGNYKKMYSIIGFTQQMTLWVVIFSYFNVLTVLKKCNSKLDSPTVDRRGKNNDESESCLTTS